METLRFHLIASMPDAARDLFAQGLDFIARSGVVEVHKEALQRELLEIASSDDDNQILRVVREARESMARLDEFEYIAKLIEEL